MRAKGLWALGGTEHRRTQRRRGSKVQPWRSTEESGVHAGRCLSFAVVGKASAGCAKVRTGSGKSGRPGS